MSYFRKRRALSGLGGAENCGADQHWDPNYVIYGIKGQCVPKTQALLPPMAYHEPSFLDVFMETLTKPASASAPVVIQQAPSSGISTTTLLVAGGAAVLLIALVASRN